VNIDLKELGSLLKLLEERQIGEFEFEDETTRLHIKRGQFMGAPSVVHTPALVTHAAPPTPEQAASAQPAAPSQDPNVAYVTSPFVGTFYRAPSPEASPFVEIGAQVRKGQALCIVEAMKLMNEIEAEFACTILECLVENAKPVEFGQKLFKVRKG
jgi:acetyl-CoA carboxylase biotin carboxyl carrier protein